MSFNVFMPAKVLFGKGELNNLHKQKMPGKKALIVVSNGKAAKINGYLERTEAQLHKAGIEFVVFDKVQPNPIDSTVTEGAAFARKNHCDFIVALGGGSVMDASKAVAAMATNSGGIWDYISGGTGKGFKIKENPLPLIAITMTAGTGSEVDAWGVISNPETKEKIGFGGDDRLFPVISIVDPELMATVPPDYTAYQGFDALLQAVEVYISNFANLMSDMVALTAIENIAANLAKAVANGNDLNAREKVAFGNMLSGLGMVYGCTTSEHSLEHAMSAYHQDLPHGAGLIIISKAYHGYFIEKHACDGRYVQIAKAMGLTDAARPEDFLTALTDLQKACGVDNLKMSDYGIAPDEFETMAKNAMETMGGLFAADPVALTIEDCAAIFKKSYR